MRASGWIMCFSLFRPTSRVCMWQAPVLVLLVPEPWRSPLIHHEYNSLGHSRCNGAFLWLIYTQPYSSWMLPWVSPNHHATSGNLTHSKASLLFIVPLAHRYHVDNDMNSFIYLCIYLFANSSSHIWLLSSPCVNFYPGSSREAPWSRCGCFQPTSGSESRCMLARSWSVLGRILKS